MPKYGWPDKEWDKAQGPYQREAIRRCFWRSCLNCDHWNDGQAKAGNDAGKPQGCRKASYSLPPPDIIVFGCDSYVEQIPF